MIGGRSIGAAVILPLGRVINARDALNPGRSKSSNVKKKIFSILCLLPLQTHSVLMITTGQIFTIEAAATLSCLNSQTSCMYLHVCLNVFRPPPRCHCYWWNLKVNCLTQPWRTSCLVKTLSSLTVWLNCLATYKENYGPWGVLEKLHHRQFHLGELQGLDNAPLKYDDRLEGMYLGPLFF